MNAKFRERDENTSFLLRESLFNEGKGLFYSLNDRAKDYLAEKDRILVFSDVEFSAVITRVQEWIEDCSGTVTPDFCEKSDQL